MIQGLLFLGIVLLIPVLFFWAFTHYGAESRLSWRIAMAGLSTGTFWLVIFLIGKSVQIPATEVWHGTLATALSTGVLIGWLLAVLLLLAAGAVRLFEGGKGAKNQPPTSHISQ